MWRSRDRRGWHREGSSVRARGCVAWSVDPGSEPSSCALHGWSCDLCPARAAPSVYPVGCDGSSLTFGAPVTCRPSPVEYSDFRPECPRSARHWTHDHRSSRSECVWQCESARRRTRPLAHPAGGRRAASPRGGGGESGVARRGVRHCRCGGRRHEQCGPGRSPRRTRVPCGSRRDRRQPATERARRRTAIEPRDRNEPGVPARQRRVRRRPAVTSAHLGHRRRRRSHWLR